MDNPRADERLVAEQGCQLLPNDPESRAARARKGRKHVKVAFDEAALREFVTGAHRRKEERRRAYQEKQADRQLEARREHRRTKRQAKQAKVQKLVAATSNEYISMSVDELHSRARMLGQPDASATADAAEGTVVASKEFQTSSGVVQATITKL